MRYTAVYRFDGRGWICQFSDPDIATFGRTIASAKEHARSLLAVHLEVADLSTAGVDVLDDIRLPSTVNVEIDILKDLRLEADRLRREVANATRTAAQELRAAGISTRDVGDLLGVSGAWVGQLEHARRGAGTNRPSKESDPEFEVRYRHVRRIRKLGEAIVSADDLVIG